MNITKADIKLFFRTNQDIGDVLGLSKQRIDQISEIKTTEQKAAIRSEVKKRMKDLVEAYARIQENGNQTPQA